MRRRPNHFFSIEAKADAESGATWLLTARLLPETHALLSDFVWWAVSAQFASSLWSGAEGSGCALWAGAGERSVWCPGAEFSVELEPQSACWLSCVLAVGAQQL